MTQNNVGYTWGERKIMPGITFISISGTETKLIVQFIHVFQSVYGKVRRNIHSCTQREIPPSKRFQFLLTQQLYIPFIFHLKEITSAKHLFHQRIIWRTENHYILNGITISRDLLAEVSELIPFSKIKHLVMDGQDSIIQLLQLKFHYLDNGREKQHINKHKRPKHIHL